MPGRAHLSNRLKAAVLLAAMLAGTGCAGGGAPVAVPSAPADATVVDQCAQLLTALPQEVDGLGRRDVEPRDAAAAAWGDPPVVLRCGVPKPAALHRASACFVVDDVGWLVTQSGHTLHPGQPVAGELTFTTVGLSTYVEVTVPRDYQPQGDVLVDLAPAILKATDTVAPCQ
ncbi:MAG: DUF3515 domain-containing protein [Nocardioidaceae bacterium]